MANIFESMKMDKDGNWVCKYTFDEAVAKFRELAAAYKAIPRKYHRAIAPEITVTEGDKTHATLWLSLVNYDFWGREDVAEVFWCLYRICGEDGLTLYTHTA
jgi:hypothetical protein